MNLEQRIARLERQNRILKNAGATLLVLLATGLFLGQQATPRQQTVQAAKFAVVDENGVERAAFGLDDGVPALSMDNAKREQVVQLYVPKFSGKPSLLLSDPQLGSNVELSMTMNGPVLHFNDKSGNRVRLATNELNAPLAAVYDAQGKILFKVASGE